MAATEKLNLQLAGIPKKPGRPFTGAAKTNAQRQSEYRARKERERELALQNTAGSFSETSDKDVKMMIVEGGSITEFMAWTELGRRRGWLK